ncbi:biotin synthase [Bacillus sp. FJAT-25509]|uniref:biotin transporter BioY n=1 Tax=Bacillaceae TaxID=186817 RepID=UPI000700F151|nr:biotin transporter BioY [Bacillus sp. FJAT-25509]KQL40035.1 biotin synthase [Bacillus sp. FJAT-25509]
MQQERLKMLINSALFAAIIGILSQVSIPLPFSPVPITGQTLAIGLAATILGKKYGTISLLLYLALGAIGIPVFAGGAAGFGVLVGSTGGYLIGFIPTIFIIAYYIEKTKFTVLNAMIANIIGMFVTLIFGTVWLKIAASLSWHDAMAFGFYPFIILGLVKAYVASALGVIIGKRLAKANLLKRDEISA